MTNVLPTAKSVPERLLNNEEEYNQTYLAEKAPYLLPIYNQLSGQLPELKAVRVREQCIERTDSEQLLSGWQNLSSPISYMDPYKSSSASMYDLKVALNFAFVFADTRYFSERRATVDCFFGCSSL